MTNLLVQIYFARLNDQSIKSNDELTNLTGKSYIIDDQRRVYTCYMFNENKLGIKNAGKERITF